MLIAWWVEEPFGVKNWERIRKGDANSLIVDSYKDASKEGLPWISGIEGHLERNSLHHLFINTFPNRFPFIHKKLHKAMIDQFNSDALSSISNPENKLRTYGLFKLEMGRELYLSEIKNKKIRTQLTKLRISDHNLMIEKGRHKGVHKNLRFCSFCQGTVEDELHFLINCPIYKYLRIPVMNSLSIENIEATPINEVFITLMTNPRLRLQSLSIKPSNLENFL